MQCLQKIRQFKIQDAINKNVNLKRISLGSVCNCIFCFIVSYKNFNLLDNSNQDPLSDRNKCNLQFNSCSHDRQQISVKQITTTLGIELFFALEINVFSFPFIFSRLTNKLKHFIVILGF